MGLEINRVKYNTKWPLVRLKNICDRISDGTHFTPVYEKYGIPFISVKDIKNNRVNFENCKYISEETHRELIKRCNPERDDILITKSGTIGRMALVPKLPKFSLFVSVALIKNRKDLVRSSFLMFCLENFLNSINISQDIKGGLLKNFHLEDIRETLIPSVSLQEQDLIISKLEELFSELDKGIENLHTAQQQLKTYRQAVLKWAFEGKLTNENVKEGELPKGWKQIAIKDVSQMNPKIPNREDID
ncbi:MAG: restriction endonuclease subunit S, partial [Cytophagales bacterium]|nr:restriction endonuclease subunit S [Cytophaga sp.]